MRFAWLVLAGCFDPTFPEGVPCSATVPCPSTQRCVGGTCNGIEPAVQDGPPGGNGDTCATAIPIALDAQMLPGTLDGATDSFDPPSSCGNDGIERVYVFDIPAGGANLTMRVSSDEFTGRFYLIEQCPSNSFNACGSITPNGSVVGTSFNEGNVFLVIEREAGNGTAFTIRP